VGFKVQNAESWIFGSEIDQKPLGEIDHEEGEANRVGDRRRLDIHEVLKAPELLGISKIELDLEAEMVYST